MEPGGPQGADEAGRNAKELQDAKDKIRQLREKLVFRCKDLIKWKFFTPASVEVPREPAKAEAEKTVFHVITSFLFENAVLVPVDTQALHKKVGEDRTDVCNLGAQGRQWGAYLRVIQRGLSAVGGKTVGATALGEKADWAGKQALGACITRTRACLPVPPAPPTDRCLARR